MRLFKQQTWPPQRDSHHSPAPCWEVDDHLRSSCAVKLQAHQAETLPCAQNVALAIQALARTLQLSSPPSSPRSPSRWALLGRRASQKGSKGPPPTPPCCLVVAGGYDERLLENRQVLAELQDLAKQLGVQERVSSVPRQIGPVGPVRCRCLCLCVWAGVVTSLSAVAGPLGSCSPDADAAGQGCLLEVHSAASSCSKQDSNGMKTGAVLHVPVTATMLSSLQTVSAVQVMFVPSFTDEQRTELLQACRAVVYTPADEHFGIVPLEAMAAGRPVIASNSGGPLETVVHKSTGFLCQPQPEHFAQAMAALAVRAPHGCIVAVVHAAPYPAAVLFAYLCRSHHLMLGLCRMMHWRRGWGSRRVLMRRRISLAQPLGLSLKLCC